jgi:hypothetical protein
MNTLVQVHVPEGETATRDGKYQVKSPPGVVDKVLPCPVVGKPKGQRKLQDPHTKHHGERHQRPNQTGPKQRSSTTPTTTTDMVLGKGKQPLVKPPGRDWSAQPRARPVPQKAKAKQAPFLPCCHHPQPQLCPHHIQPLLAPTRISMVFVNIESPPVWTPGYSSTYQLERMVQSVTLNTGAAAAACSHRSKYCGSTADCTNASRRSGRQGFF